MADYHVEKMSPALGARVTGLDLREEVDDDTIAGLRRLFVDNAVLCFADQRVSAQDQARFAGFFGRVDAGFRPPSYQLDNTNKKRGVMLVTNIRKDGKQIGSLPDGEMHFHSDGAHRDVPYRATTLFAIKIPSRGGETLFANLANAYDALPEDERDRLEGLKANHAYRYDLVTRDLNDDSRDDLNRAVHPLVKTHPDTGRKALYLSRLMTQTVVGMEKAESDATLLPLFDHIERPEFVHAHNWTPGDLVIWDNRTVNHARNDFPAEEDRLLRRYTVSEPGQATPDDVRPQ